MKNILCINACVRKNSRTKRFCDSLLPLISGKDGIVTELVLDKEGILPLDGDRLSLRDTLTRGAAFDDAVFRYARQFAAAEEIVIAAPFWDLSYPALLKIYLENVSCVGVTFRYNENGIPTGLCRARRLSFITTAGGAYDPRFGFWNIRSLCQGMFGIPEVLDFHADMLDVDGFDPEKRLDAAILSAKETLQKYT